MWILSQYLVILIAQMEWLTSAVSSVVKNRSQILEYMDAYGYRRKLLKSLSLNIFDKINKERPRLVDFNRGQLVNIMSGSFNYNPANFTDRNNARFF